MNKAKVGVVAAALAAFAAEARMFDVTMWRGETLAVRIPDFAEMKARPPEGVTLKYGVMRPVKYAPQPGSLQRLECYDRVEWGGKGDGPRVVEVSVAPDAKAGEYFIGEMHVSVADRVLPPPREWKFYLDLWQHPWASARIAGAKPFSKEHYAAMRPVYELLATAGQKTVTVPILDRPWDHQCFDAYHSLVEDEDFRTFDEYVRFCLDCGLGPDISCYSLCPWKLKEAPGTPEFEARWAPFLKRFAAHLKDKGWYERTIMAMDERDPAQVKAVVDFVHKYAPGMRISMAGNRKPSDFKGIDIDNYCQILSDVSPDFLAEVPARRARGFVTTFYVCCWPKRPNTFMSSGEGEAFWLGAYPAMAGLDGFLRWAWNSWPQNPYADATYWAWDSGDTFLCYPDGSPSWRFLELRHGISSAEKLRILRAEGKVTDAEFNEVAGAYVLKEALEGKSNFPWVRDRTLQLVNGK